MSFGEKSKVVFPLSFVPGHLLNLTNLNLLLEPYYITPMQVTASPVSGSQ